MNTFARLVDGLAVDVVTTPPSLEKRFAPEWLAQRTFYDAPADTLPGRAGVLNQDGSVTWGANPVQPPTVTTDAVLTKDPFIDYCTLQFGNNTVGPARFGAIIVAMRGSTDPTVGYAISKYDAAVTVTKTQAQKFFQAARAASLPAGSVVTTQEITTIVTNWPQV